MSKAPKGSFRIISSGGNASATRRVFEPADIIVAGRHGTVTVAHWMDDEKRFNMFSAEHPPIAWQPYAGPRAYVDDKGKTRYAVDLPPHPNGDEPWLATFMREVGSALPPVQRQRACLNWIAARRVAA